MNYRADFHDYSSRCFYLLTVTKARGIPDFSVVTGSSAIKKPAPGSPAVRLLPAGEAIASAIKDFRGRFPAVSIIRHVIMPDHIHMVVYVKERLPRPLGEYVAILKGSCSANIWAVMPQARFSIIRHPVFEQGYNDRILFRGIKLDTFLRYVEDNPRRLLVRRENPGFFTCVNNLSIDGREMSAYGNPFLLDDPQKSAVRISRSFTTEELRRRKLQWLATVRNGGVLVSPFISPAEKKVRDWAVANGGKIIQLLPNGFPPKYKPPGSAFGLCSQGRLLQVAPTLHQAAKMEMTRARAMEMNRLAELISADNA